MSQASSIPPAQDDSLLRVSPDGPLRKLSKAHSDVSDGALLRGVKELDAERAEEALARINVCWYLTGPKRPALLNRASRLRSFLRR